MNRKVLSLDVSASSSGFAFIDLSKKVNVIKYGLIKTTTKYSRARRLRMFKSRLINLLEEYKPTDVVIEDIYLGKNPTTSVLLAKFAGVAEETILDFCNIDAYIIHTSTVKAFYKAKDKKILFDFMIDILDWQSKKLSFEKNNDITDAIAQLLCYCDSVLNYKNFRFEKDYGFLYEV